MINKVCLVISFLIFILTSCVGHTAPTANFRVAVIVEITSDWVSEEQAAAVLAKANEQMIAVTEIGLKLVDFIEDDSGGSIENIAMAYMEKHQANLLNGILIFSVGDEDRAKINRAYAQQVPGPAGFRNPFVSPIPELGDSHIYIAVVQFNHLFAACGYGGTDTIQSPISIGEECRGEVGSLCAAWEGMQVCEIALPFLEGRTRIDMVAEPIVHEFLHPFGLLGGPDNHYGTEACNLTMGWEPGHFDEVEGKSNAMMCPNVVDNFVNSYQP